MPITAPLSADTTLASDTCMLRPVEASPQPDVLARADSTWIAVPSLEEMARCYGGRVAGDSLPFCFRNNDTITSLLLLLLFVSTFIVSHGWAYFVSATGEFFQGKRHDTIFDTHEEKALHGGSILVAQTAVCMGLLAFGFLDDYYPQQLLEYSPYVLLGFDIAICTAWLLLRVGLFQFVNNILFEREACRTWMNGMWLILMLCGLLLLPVTLLAIYFDLSLATQQSALILIGGVSEILLVYKSYITFFRHKGGILHLILYLCALEIIPLLLLWRTFDWANTFTLT